MKYCLAVKCHDAMKALPRNIRTFGIYWCSDSVKKRIFCSLSIRLRRFIMKPRIVTKFIAKTREWHSLALRATCKLVNMRLNNLFLNKVSLPLIWKIQYAGVLYNQSIGGEGNRGYLFSAFYTGAFMAHTHTLLAFLH